MKNKKKKKKSRKRSKKIPSSFIIKEEANNITNNGPGIGTENVTGVEIEEIFWPVTTRSGRFETSTGTAKKRGRPPKLDSSIIKKILEQVCEVRLIDILKNPSIETVKNNINASSCSIHQGTHRNKEIIANTITSDFSFNNAQPSITNVVNVRYTTSTNPETYEVSTNNKNRTLNIEVEGFKEIETTINDMSSKIIYDVNTPKPSEGSKVSFNKTTSIVFKTIPEAETCEINMNKMSSTSNIEILGSQMFEVNNKNTKIYGVEPIETSGVRIIEIKNSSNIYELIEGAERYNIGVNNINTYRSKIVLQTEISDIKFENSKTSDVDKNHSIIEMSEKRNEYETTNICAETILGENEDFENSNASTYSVESELQKHSNSRPCPYVLLDEPIYFGTGEKCLNNIRNYYVDYYNRIFQTNLTYYNANYNTSTSSHQQTEYSVDELSDISSTCSDDDSNNVNKLNENNTNHIFNAGSSNGVSTTETVNLDEFNDFESSWFSDSSSDVEGSIDGNEMSRIYTPGTSNSLNKKKTESNNFVNQLIVPAHLSSSDSKVPNASQKKIIFEWIMNTNQRKVLQFACTHSVADLIYDYVAHETEKCSNNADKAYHFSLSVLQYFNETVSKQLLTSKERSLKRKLMLFFIHDLLKIKRRGRSTYLKILKPKRVWCFVYGPVHLLRTFYLLNRDNYSCLSEIDIAKYSDNINSLLRFMCDNFDKYCLMDHQYL